MGVHLYALNQNKAFNTCPCHSSWFPNVTDTFQLDIQGSHHSP